MPTNALNVKRKNIDLPIDTLQKLSLMAVTQGKSLKAYIESILIHTADSVTINITPNPSPSGDKWFDDPSNLRTIDEGIAQHKSGQGKSYSLTDIHDALGL